MEETYQAYLPIEGSNPAEDDLTEKNVEYLSKLEKLRVKRLTIGFATEADESRLRHVEADVYDSDGQLHENIDHDDSEWPEELNFNRDYCPWDYLDNFDLDRLLTIYPSRRVIELGSGLYITEPELRTEDGDECFWNYHD